MSERNGIPGAFVDPLAKRRVKLFREKEIDTGLLKMV